jgi:hypothetical protein
LTPHEDQDDDAYDDDGDDDDDDLMRLGPRSLGIGSCLNELIVRMIPCGWVHNLLDFV